MEKILKYWLHYQGPTKSCCFQDVPEDELPGNYMIFSSIHYIPTLAYPQI